MMRWTSLIGLVLAVGSPANGQSSSLLRHPTPASVRPPMTTDSAGMSKESSAFFAVPPENATKATTRTLENYSLFAIPTLGPRKFQVEDLVTIIVRQQKKYQSDGEYESKNKWNLDGELSQWFRFYPRNRLGADKLSNGNPGFKFDLKNDTKNEGDNKREDSFTTRIQARIIDVKPNGNLVLEARQSEQHDEEELEITLTGTCRSEDVTADNTVLSTQVAELELVEKNKGSVRDATKRGWVPKILDYVKPF